MSYLRIRKGKLVHVVGKEARAASLKRFTKDAKLTPDTPVVIITEELFERLKFLAQCNATA